MLKLYIRIKQFILFNYMVALVSQGNINNFIICFDFRSKAELNFLKGDTTI
jgi:hypothetical protein